VNANVLRDGRVWVYWPLPPDAGPRGYAFLRERREGLLYVQHGLARWRGGLSMDWARWNEPSVSEAPDYWAGIVAPWRDGAREPHACCGVGYGKFSEHSAAHCPLVWGAR